MKEMEAKTENRYEYRKPQEKRKQMIAPDLFEFAYVPDWYGHLAELERLALPESWKFRKPSRETKNTDTPILERYIHTIFRKQVIDFNSESDPRKADSIFHLEHECVCFHTGLYTPQYKGIYGYFDRNNFSDSLRDWYFRGFCDELSPKLRYIEPLPQKPVYHMAQSGINFNPEWPIRVNVNHILGDEENLERIPAKIRKVKNLPLLFETAVELGRRKSVIEPGLVVPQGYQGRVQYLLPVYLTNMQKPDLAMTLTVMDGADGMTFASINNGKEYVENTEYSTEIRVSTLDCSSFTNPYQMLEYTEMRLADYSKPSISYVIQVMDLSVLTGWEHESFGIGDVVTVDDKDLGIRISTRIIRMDYNVQEPWKTVIELSTKLKELGDSSASWEKAADTLSSSDLLDRQEMKDLVVNNHLLNSRADDGFSYWQNSGFEVDGENGASGNASFKCVGALNTTKTLSQEVYPATRSSYTVSASIATENLKKGANGRVGIELIIEYEDGSEETRFVELY